MSIGITHNDDGSVTVECDGDTVVIPARRSTPSRPAQGIHTLPPPLRPRIGDPKIGPRFMLYTPDGIRPADVAKLSAFPTIPELRSLGGSSSPEVLNVRLALGEAIQVKDVLSVGGESSQEIRLWIPPLKL